MRRILFLCVVLASVPAFAQQQQPSAAEQALGDRLLVEVQANVQARAQLIEAQRQLAAAQARIKELEKTAEVPK
jgi:hypothetical protein